MEATNPRRLEREVLTGALVAAGAGVWDWDVERDVVRCCTHAAKLFGFSPEEGANGMAQARYVERIVEEDWDARKEQVQAAVDQGGHLVMEYRTQTPPGRFKWIVSRGFFDKDPDGRVRRGRGIVIDVTGGQRGVDLQGRALCATDLEPGLSLVDRAADHAMALWSIQSQPDFDAQLDIAGEVRSILVKVGQSLARRIKGAMPLSVGIH